MRTIILLYVLPGLFVTLGCAESARESAREAVFYTARDSVTAAIPEPAAAPLAPDFEAPGLASAGMMGMMSQATPPAFPGADQAAFPGADQPAPAPEGVPRKIIYNADISLVVEDYETTEQRISRLVESSGGYIADLNASGSPGAQRSARWKLRIPVASFEGFLREVLALGELESNRRTTEDVTEQYFDIEARIKNKQVEEQRLIEILEQTTGKLEEVLRVEVELSRVRGEIEQLQGRLRLLANLTSLTTVTIQIRERARFEPPPPVAADFQTQVARSFQGSLDDLRRLGESAVIFAAGWGLWLLVVILPSLLIGLVLLRWALRILLRLILKAWQQSRVSLTRT